MNGDAKLSPLLSLLGIDFVSVDKGWVTLRMKASERLYGPRGVIHDGATASILIGAMDCAIRSALQPGQDCRIIELKINPLDGAAADAGFVNATGHLVDIGSDQALVEARLLDADGRLCATASATGLIFEASKPAGRSTDETTSRLDGAAE